MKQKHSKIVLVGLQNQKLIWMRNAFVCIIDQSAQAFLLMEGTGSINDYMTRIQQVDEVAKRTIALQEKRIPEKYSSIETTLKLLQNLIATYRRRADSYEQDLKARAKIDDLTTQISFHNDRLADCERLSQNLSAKISQKKDQVKEDEKRVCQLRKEIIGLKTENVKKILRIQELERIEQRQKAKENQQNRKLTWKIKTQYNREFYRQLGTDSAQQQQLDILVREKDKLTQALYKRLEKRSRIQVLIGQAFTHVKSKLNEKERKANLNGMHGSLLFKMISNDTPTSLKSLGDKKLMIYDVLKAKHNLHVKQERRASQTSQVTEEQFLEFNPLQIMGIVQLEGGYKRLQDLIAQYEQNQTKKSTSLPTTASIDQFIE